MSVSVAGMLMAVSALIAFQASALAMSTMECRSALMKWKQQKDHKAFVVGRHMDYEYCGWSTGAGSKDAAIKAATDACVKAGARACTVHSAR